MCENIPTENFVLKVLFVWKDRWWHGYAWVGLILSAMGFFNAMLIVWCQATNQNLAWELSNKVEWLKKTTENASEIAVLKLVSNPCIEGILLKGPYPPCLRMATGALLAGYPRYIGAVYWCQQVTRSLIGHDGSHLVRNQYWIGWARHCTVEKIPVTMETLTPYQWCCATQQVEHDTMHGAVNWQVLHTSELMKRWWDAVVLSAAGVLISPTQSLIRSWSVRWLATRLLWHSVEERMNEWKRVTGYGA